MVDPPAPRVVAVLLAAGSGSRLGGAAKGFLEIGGGPLVARCLRSMAASGVIDAAVVMVPDGYAESWDQDVPPGLEPVVIKVGGRTRQESVGKGIDALPDTTEVVVCHDAARPFASPDLFRRVVAGMGEADGVVPAIESQDTVKRVRDGIVLETIPRDSIRLVQTPQAFSAPALRRAHRLAVERGLEATDDATLLEAAGFTVITVEGEPANLKVTTEADLARAEWMLRDGSRVATEDAR